MVRDGILSFRSLTLEVTRMIWIQLNLKIKIEIYIFNFYILKFHTLNSSSLNFGLQRIGNYIEEPRLSSSTD